MSPDLWPRDGVVRDPDGVGSDLSAADLSGGDFGEPWFPERGPL